MDIDDYGPKFRDHLLEQYKIYTEMADRISQRRATCDGRQLLWPDGLPHQRILPVLVVAPSTVACSGGGKVTPAKTSSPSHASSN